MFIAWISTAVWAFLLKPVPWPPLFVWGFFGLVSVLPTDSINCSWDSSNSPGMTDPLSISAYKLSKPVKRKLMSSIIFSSSGMFPFSYKKLTISVAAYALPNSVLLPSKSIFLYSLALRNSSPIIFFAQLTLWLTISGSNFLKLLDPCVDAWFKVR